MSDIATSATTSEDHEKHIGGNVGAYVTALILLALLWGVGGWFLINQSFEFLGQDLNLGYLVWIIGVLYFAASIQVIGPEQLGGVLVAGIPTIVATGFPILVPPIFFRLEVLTRSTIQMEIPDEPEKIFRNEDKERVPEGMRPPIRITFANPKKDDSAIDRSDPLEQRTTNEVTIFVRWRIRKEYFWSFYVRIGDLVQARKQLEDMSVGLLQDKLTKLTPSQAFAQLGIINNELDDHIRLRTQTWGIEIVDARIKLIGLSHALNSAIQNIAESKAQKQTIVNLAEGAREDLRLKGEGAALATKAEIDARTDGMARMAKELDVEGKDIVGVEAAREIGKSPSSKVIIGTDGFKEIVGVGAAVTDAFIKKSET